jgi:hypothetical protein
MLRYCLLLIPLVLAACGNKGNRATGRTAASSSVATTYSPENTTGDFYRRYSGTIAGQPVVLQLHRFAGSYSGSYQYVAQGKMIRLSQDETTADRIVFTEYPPEAAGNQQAHLLLSIGEKNLSGEWVSAAGDKRQPVTLQEAYPQGSARLLAAHLDDTAHLIEGKALPFATASYRYLLPATQEPWFVGRSLIGLLANRQTPADDVDQVLRSETDTYFERYRHETLPMLQENMDTSAMFAFNYSTEKSVEVLHNDRNWIVLRDLSGEYTGGAHGYYASSFVNIDVEGARLWALRDIVSDTNALRPLLNDAAINYFKLKPGSGMANRLLVDEVPTTANIFISATGISFVYNPYEIASYADGEIMLFLPYTKLSSLLTDAFRNRMGLGTRAGVASNFPSVHSRANAPSRL